MRILLDCSRLVAGGGVQVGLSLLKSASETDRHEWHVVLSSSLAAELPDDVISCFSRVWCLQNSRRIWSQLRESFRVLPRIERVVSPDIVFTVRGPVLWRARAPHLIGYAIPHLLYPEMLPLIPQTSAQRLKMRAVLAWTAFRAQRGMYWTVQTETVKRRLHEYLGAPSERIFVVRNTYSRFFRAANACPRPAADRNIFRILVPSAAYPHKNFPLVPLVAERLRRSATKDFEFVFTLDAAGDSWKGLVMQAESVGTEHHLRTVGPVPHAEIQALYARADAVFLPTLLECSTAVYPESFVAGVPVVTSDLDFAHELCRDGALFFDPRSADEGAAALARLMGEPDLRAHLVTAGRRALREVYPTPEAQWDEYLRCFEGLSTLHERRARNTPSRS